VSQTETTEPGSVELIPEHPPVFQAPSATAAGDSSSASGLATGAREVNRVLPIGTPGYAQPMDKAGEGAPEAPVPAVLHSNYPSSQISAAGSAYASRQQVAIAKETPAPPVATSLNPSTGPSVPVRAAKSGEAVATANPAPSSEPQSRLASEPVATQSLTPSTEAESRTAGDAPRLPGQVRFQTEESLQSPSQARTPVHPRLGSQEVVAVAPPIAADRLQQAPVLQSTAPLQSAQVASAFAFVGKDGSAKSDGAQPAIRSLRSTRDVRSIPQGYVQADVQIAGRTTDSYPQIRDVAGASAPTVQADGSPGSPVRGTTSPITHETFAALDGGTATESPTWIHAGTQRAEAGFHDPALGWVGVRADSASGGVHASLVPDSVAAAQTLGGHVAGLNTYLAEQHTPVETLTVATPESHSLASGMDQAGSQGMHQGSGQDSGQSGYSEALSDLQQSTSAVAAEVAAAGGGKETNAPAIDVGGLHISVMA